MRVSVFHNTKIDIYRVVIGDEMFDMSADAHLPNGYCQYAGPCTTDYPSFPNAPNIADMVPHGIVRAIARIIVGKMSENGGK